MIPCLEKAKWCHGSWSSHGIAVRGDYRWLMWSWWLWSCSYSCFKIFHASSACSHYINSSSDMSTTNVVFACLCKSCHLFRRVLLLHRTSIRFGCPNWTKHRTIFSHVFYHFFIVVWGSRPSSWTKLPPTSYQWLQFLHVGCIAPADTTKGVSSMKGLSWKWGKTFCGWNLRINLQFNTKGLKALRTESTFIPARLGS